MASHRDWLADAAGIVGIRLMQATHFRDVAGCRSITPMQALADQPIVDPDAGRSVGADAFPAPQVGGSSLAHRLARSGRSGDVGGDRRAAAGLAGALTDCRSRDARQRYPAAVSGNGPVERVFKGESKGLAQDPDSPSRETNDLESGRTDMSDRPKLCVVGAGAMGSLFGGLLAEGGMDVTLIDIWREHVDAIAGRGLRLVGQGGDREIPIKAVRTTNGLPVADIIFVQCKAMNTESAVSSARNIVGMETVLISFQNGLSNEELLASIVGAGKVLGGLTAQAASIEAPGVVRNFAELPTYIGEMPGGISARATQLSALFSRHGLPTTPSSDIRLDIWTKLMANVGLSAASGIANLRIREVMALQELRATVLAAIDEAVAVGRAAGVSLDAADVRDVLERIVGVGGSGENKSSLCVDLLNKRATEIDFINGAIVRLGKDHGIATPVNATLVAAVKALESHYL